MHNFGHFGLDSNLSLGPFSTWCKLPLGSEYASDVNLQLNSVDTCNPNPNVRKRKWGDTSPSLALSLRPSSSSWDISSAKETTDDETSADLGFNFNLQLGGKKPNVTTTKAFESGVDLQLSLSVGQSKSVITSVSPIASRHQNSFDSLVQVSTGDENGSASSQLMPNLYISSETASSFPIKKRIVLRSGNTKTCQFVGCGKGTRGASGFCIAHGGGRRCQKAGCHKGAEGKTVYYCKAHGGGRRCQHLGCTKSAEGRTDFCIGHGGGRRCSAEGSSRAARGKSGLCIRHGGGRRCRAESCTRSAEGYSGLCISHGGGRRCQYLACVKGAQGSTMFCKAHGGGKRCTILGCTKGAEGNTAFCKGHGGGKRCCFQGGGKCPKSVHGGTLFCVAHGGGKRCAIPGCTKSARGRTDFCVRHGGGKRCKSDGCGKSAQGSTDFCKAHGGGKRCLWAPPCDRFARGKSGLCAAHDALMREDRCIDGGGGKTGEPDKHEEERESVTPVDEEEESFTWSGLGLMDSAHTEGPPASSVPVVPEGRVHGGSLMTMLLSELHQC